MIPELARKWAAALRSGNYTQGKNRLRNDNGTYCCLGVLLDVLLKEPSPQMNVLPGEIQYALERYASLPDRIGDATGLHHEESCVFIAMNDTDGKTFKEIAEAVLNKYAPAETPADNSDAGNEQAAPSNEPV